MEYTSNKAEIPLLVSPDVCWDVLLGYKSLWLLGMISKTFPKSCLYASSGFNSSNASNSEAEILKKKFVCEFPNVITLRLPKEAMIGGYMDIHLNNCKDIPPTKVTMARLILLHFRKEVDEIISKAF